MSPPPTPPVAAAALPAAHRSQRAHRMILFVLSQGRSRTPFFYGEGEIEAEERRERER